MDHLQHGTRRSFLKIAGLGTAAALATGTTGLAPLAGAAEQSPSKPEQRPLRLALASYTLRKFDLDQTVAMTKRLGLEAICLKSFHLPLEATPDEIAAAAAKVRDAGLVLYGCGVVTMKSDEQVDQAFDYAKAAGMTDIVAAPTPEMLPRIEAKVREYDLRVCIHNHGPGDTHFPTPVAGYEKIQGLDKRIGLCHDVGHTIRYGEDAIEQGKKVADRVYDVHIKDVTEPTKAGQAIACGRGVIDLPRLLHSLIQTGYGGYLAFEYEAEADDPLPGLAESVGYIRGVLDMLG
ncbi:MAG: sugar phosphate isomerase/epimerase [Pirellulaceae bacterium]|nr:sugar phosphate isomerase/epimerase [Pirellulaceae bacterium]